MMRIPRVTTHVPNRFNQFIEFVAQQPNARKTCSSEMGAKKRSVSAAVHFLHRSLKSHAHGIAND
jgi:hypothetical protein